MENENIEATKIKEINLLLTLDEANVLLAALGELPAKISLPLITKIKNQAVHQLSTVENTSASEAQ